MKKFILSSLVVFFSVAVFAFDTEPVDRKKNDLNNQSFELLIKNMDMIKMSGDVLPNEKLKPILEELADFIGDHLFSIMSGDKDDYDGRIKNFTADCAQLSERRTVAKCQIIIQYKPMGETGITFYVGLDKDKKPVSILENRVEISRGD